MSKSKIEERAFYQPGASSIEGWPTTLQFFYAHPPIMLMPHWHAQVEVNYVMSGSVHYRIAWPGVSADEKREGWILPCVAYPTSDLCLE